MRLDLPIADDLVDELFSFWEGIFGPGSDIGREVFRGSEVKHNAGTLYIQREAETLAGTCMTLHSVDVPGIGGFAEVATGTERRCS